MVSTIFVFSAPMKALAAEIVRKLGKRLAWLSVRVRELTGMVSKLGRVISYNCGFI